MGFWVQDYITSIPDSSSIIKALTNIGINNIKLRDGYIYKMNVVTLDFSAIAKGYAVDKIADILKK